VSGLEKRATPVVEIPEEPTEARLVPQDFDREVGALQMLRPGDVEAIDMLVYCLQTMNFLIRKFFCYHYDEVNIAVKIEITHRERPLEVGTYEVGAQDRLHPVDDISQNAIEIWIGGWKCFVPLFHISSFSTSSLFSPLETPEFILPETFISSKVRYVMMGQPPDAASCLLKQSRQARRGAPSLS
jgi:hypothetical protein